MNMRVASLFAVLAVLVALAAFPAGAVVIPLDRSASGESAESIAYVDLERLFVEHPLTRRFKDELNAEIEKRRTELALMESEIARLDYVIVSSATELGSMKAERDSLALSSAPAPAPIPAPAVSTGTQQSPTAAGPQDRMAALDAALREKSQGIDQLRQELTRKRATLNAKAKENKEDLVALEQKQSQEVMADIYHLLDKVSDEEGITIIFDKTGLVYGKKVRDITPKVIERLKGR